MPQYITEDLEYTPAHMVTENSEHVWNATRVWVLAQMPAHNLQFINGCLRRLLGHLLMLVQERDSLFGCHGAV